MNIKGQYRDVITKNIQVLEDRGWRSNTIVPDYGRFLAALMKKDFSTSVGLEYLALGSGSEGEKVFKERISAYFTRLNEEPTFSGPLFTSENNEHWVWAKKITEADVKYLNDLGETIETIDMVTNRLEIEVKIVQNEPTVETLVFREFALLGIDRKDGEFNTTRLFLVNYVTHGPITKDKDMELSRTIKLIFPISEPQANG